MRLAPDSVSRGPVHGGNCTLAPAIDSGWMDGGGWAGPGRQSAERSESDQLYTAAIRCDGTGAN